jgi:hypothetical protein
MYKTRFLNEFLFPRLPMHKYNQCVSHRSVWHMPIFDINRHRVGFNMVGFILTTDGGAVSIHRFGLHFLVARGVYPHRVVSTLFHESTSR